MFWPWNVKVILVCHWWCQNLLRFFKISLKVVQTSLQKTII
jgi:hypothetical protein